MTLVRSQDNPFNITAIPVSALTTDTDEAEGDQFFEDPEDLRELTPKQTKKKISIHYRGLERKSRKSKET